MSWAFVTGTFGRRVLLSKPARLLQTVWKFLWRNTLTAAIPLVRRSLMTTAIVLLTHRALATLARVTVAENVTKALTILVSELDCRGVSL